VPPLREREVDAVLLAHQVVRRYNRSLGTRVRSFAPEVLPALLKYDWPGNVRELENAIKAALVVSRGAVLRLESLPEHIRKAAERESSAGKARAGRGQELSTAELRTVAERLVAQPALEGKLHELATGFMEREIIRVCLERSRGQLAPAARLLGITRATLRKKMGAHAIRGSVSYEFGDADQAGC
jgi:DNA-binding NtrC family response regulator